MPKYATIEIQESVEELHSQYRKIKDYRLRVRLKAIILLKEKRFKRMSTVAEHLGISISSLKRWVNIYKSNGLEYLLQIKSGGARRNSIPLEVHEALTKKLNDPYNSLSGYIDAVNWVKENFGIEIKYNTLRGYMIRNFNTKLKTPRKSHHKKDAQAVEAFKKTTRSVSAD